MSKHPPPDPGSGDCAAILEAATRRLAQERAGKHHVVPPLSGQPRCGTDETAGPVELTIRPCFTLRWGDGPRDQIETGGTETMQIVARNPYANVILKDVEIKVAAMLFEGKSAPRLPSGASSVDLTPTEFICFGDLQPCGPEVVREVSLTNRAARPGRYELAFTYCHSVEFLQPIVEKYGFEVKKGKGCAMLTRKLVGWILLGLLILLLLLLCIIFVLPRLFPWPEVAKTYVYSAKYVCVPELGLANSQLSPVIPMGNSADYRSAINIHNFQGEAVTVQQQIVAPNDPSSTISPQVQWLLEPNQLREIDCQDIVAALTGLPTNSPTGFLVIESPVELDVVAVYSSVFYQREKDDQVVDQTTMERDEATRSEAADKYVVVIKQLWAPTDERIADALAALGIKSGANEIEVIAPTPLGSVLSPEEAIRTGLIEALSQKLIEQGVDPDQARQQAKDFVDMDLKIIKIKTVEFGLGTGHGLGLGVGRGIGRGIGIGIGAGISVDVEYIEPKVIRSRTWGWLY